MSTSIRQHFDATTQTIRKVKLRNGILTVDITSRSLAPEFPAFDAEAVRRFVRELNDDPIAVRAPKGEDAPASAPG